MFFEQLNFYYDSYIKYFKVNQKIILLKQIKSREKMFILLHENKKIYIDSSCWSPDAYNSFGMF